MTRFALSEQIGAGTMMTAACFFLVRQVTAVQTACVVLSTTSDAPPLRPALRARDVIFHLKSVPYRLDPLSTDSSRFAALFPTEPRAQRQI